MAKETVKLSVSVEVPEGFDRDKIDLPSFLSKFIEIGLSDLEESVEDKNIDSSMEEEFVCWRTKWGVVDYN